MKHKLLLAFSFLFTLVLFTNCKANYPVTQQSGKEDIAYLLFVSESNKSYDVDVKIDNSIAFTAKTVKSKNAKSKGTVYTINTGKRKILVSKNGIRIYEKYLFLSPQETKTISLQ